MLYLFTGNNRYLITKETQKWKNAFEEKYGAENITNISNLDSVSRDDISEALLARGLFTEKRLVIIDGFPFSGERAFSGASEIESTILDCIESIPDEVLVVFMSESPDKRKAGYKTLSKKAEVKEFSISSEGEVESMLSRKYNGKIDSAALKRIVFLKGGNLSKCVSEIDKILIAHDSIDLTLVNSVIQGEFEESIFVFIDTLLAKDASKIFNEFDNLLSFSNLYALYQSIIANLRVFLYIELLKKEKKSQNEIGDILKLGNRAFLAGKRYKASFKDIETLYFDLLAFDKNMKFGKFLSSDEEDLKKELERSFLKFVS